MPTSKDSGYLIPTERLDNAILEIRGERVMLDYDLAAIYGVTTKALNQAVKRNRDRFPADFMLELTLNEKEELVTNCDRLAVLKHSSSLPYAFTEHGAVMLACVLKSRRAVEVSVFLVRAFIRMRRMLTDQRQLAFKLAELEGKLAVHDRNFQMVFAAIKQLISRPNRRRSASASSRTTVGPVRPAQAQTSSPATDPAALAANSPASPLPTDAQRRPFAPPVILSAAKNLRLLRASSE